MFNFGFGFGFILIIDLAFAWHIIRTGRSPLWIAVVGFLGPLGWAIYFFFGILPDMMASHGARALGAGIANAADPGRGFREKKRLAENVGSADSKRALAEEYLARGEAQEAIALYRSAMVGALEGEPSLLLGLGRAELAAGDGAASEAHLAALRAADPALFNESGHLPYARALELQGKTDEALREYESLAPRYPGPEARLRFALLLEKLGAHERAQGQFREIVESMHGAPGYVQRREREWINIARQKLAGGQAGGRIVKAK